jgi:hypothetical protein
VVCVLYRSARAALLLVALASVIGSAALRLGAPWGP